MAARACHNSALHADLSAPLTEASCNCYAGDLGNNAPASPGVYHHEQVQMLTVKVQVAGRGVGVVHQHSECGRCSSLRSWRVIGVDECVGLQGVQRCQHKCLQSCLQIASTGLQCMCRVCVTSICETLGCSAQGL